MRERKRFQKVLMGVAVISYVAAFLCAVTAAVISDGTASPAVASFMASVVFFAGVGIVLQVISSTSLPNFRAERERN